MERNWKRLLKKHKPMQLVAAGDALTAKLIEFFRKLLARVLGPCGFLPISE